MLLTKNISSERSTEVSLLYASLSKKSSIKAELLLKFIQNFVKTGLRPDQISNTKNTGILDLISAQHSKSSDLEIEYHMAKLFLAVEDLKNLNLKPVEMFNEGTGILDLLLKINMPGDGLWRFPELYKEIQECGISINQIINKEGSGLLNKLSTNKNFNTLFLSTLALTLRASKASSEMKNQILKNFNPGFIDWVTKNLEPYLRLHSLVTEALKAGLVLNEILNDRSTGLFNIIESYIKNDYPEKSDIVMNRDFIYETIFNLNKTGFSFEEIINTQKTGILNLMTKTMAEKIKTDESHTGSSVDNEPNEGFLTQEEIDMLISGTEGHVSKSEVRRFMKIFLTHMPGLIKSGFTTKDLMNQQESGLFDLLIKNHSDYGNRITLILIILQTGLTLKQIINQEKTGLLDVMGERTSILSVNNSKNFIMLCNTFFKSHYLKHSETAFKHFEEWAKLSKIKPNEKIEKKLIQFINQKENSKEFVDLISKLNIFLSLGYEWPKEIPDASMGEMNLYWEKQITERFYEKYNIPSDIAADSSAILQYGRLGNVLMSKNQHFGQDFILEELPHERNQTVDAETRKILTFRLLVIMDILGKTKEVKSRNLDPEILKKYFTEKEIDILQSIPPQNFPLLENPQKLEIWLKESSQQYHLNTGTTTPQQEVDNITFQINEALAHLRPPFLKEFQQYDTPEKIKQEQRLLADQAKKLYQESKGKGSDESYQKTVNQQKKLSVINLLNNLKKDQAHLIDYLGLFEGDIKNIEKEKELLALIGYQMPESPGIFLWSGEIQLVALKLKQPEMKEKIKKHGLEEAQKNLTDQLEKFDQKVKQFKDFIENLKKRIEKAQKELQALGEEESSRQLENAISVIHESKSAKSEVVVISDLTDIHKILTALKEDNHCLSPDSSLNGDTNMSFLDPNRKLLTIRNKSGKLLANMLLTLGYRNNQAILLMDNVYSLGDPKLYYEPIVNYLRERFKDLEIPIVATEQIHGKTKISNEKNIPKAFVQLPAPLWGTGYHESTGEYSRYDKKLEFQKNISVYTADSRPAHNIKNNIPDTAYSVLFSGLSRNSYKIEKANGNVDIYLDGAPKIVINLNDLHRKDGSRELFIGLEIKSSRGGRFPGQDEKGSSLKNLITLFKNIKNFAKTHGYAALGADPEFYHTYVLLKRAKFSLDPEAENAKRDEAMLQDLEKYFAEENIKSMRQRSQMIENGQVKINGQIFRWPDENHRIFMTQKI